MARPLVIVQSSPLKQTAFDLAAAARARGYAVQDISFHRDGEQLPVTAGYSPIFVYGSVALREHWATHYPALRPWLWYDHERLGPATWAEAFGDHFLNAGGEAVTVRDFLREARFADRLWHVRPMRNDKRPPGKVHDRTTFAALALPETTLLWVAPPAAIAAEARIWFIGGEVAAASLYRLDDAAMQRADGEDVAEAVDAATHLGRRFLPHPHCVMDVARVPAGGWKLLEFNPIHGAGWYAADPGVILDAFVRHFDASG